MQDQHKHIRGYRDLTPADIALMNTLKRQEASLQRVLSETSAMFVQTLEAEATNGTINRYTFLDKSSTHHELMAKAKDQLLIGFMLAVRAIAQPQPLQEEQAPFIPWRAVNIDTVSDEKLRSHPDQLVLAINEDNQIEQTTFATVRSEFARVVPANRGIQPYYHSFCPIADLPLPKG